MILYLLSLPDGPVWTSKVGLVESVDSLWKSGVQFFSSKGGDPEWWLTRLVLGSLEFVWVCLLWSYDVDVSTEESNYFILWWWCSSSDNVLAWSGQRKREKGLCKLGKNRSYKLKFSHIVSREKFGALDGFDEIIFRRVNPLPFNCQFFFSSCQSFIWGLLQPVPHSLLLMEAADRLTETDQMDGRELIMFVTICVDQNVWFCNLHSLNEITHLLLLSFSVIHHFLGCAFQCLLHAVCALLLIYKISLFAWNKKLILLEVQNITMKISSLV